MNCKNQLEKMNIHVLRNKRWFHAHVAVILAVISVFMSGFSMAASSAEMTDASKELSEILVRESPLSRENDPFSEISFPTFNRTGFEICTNDKGQPLIMLFSLSTCSHCEWAGSIFDFIARYYSAGGHIEAHHYDVSSGDDLLTEEIETEIPAAHLKIKEHGDPKDLVPYFNFGCKFERVGNGYEEEGDLAAEGAEIRKVIDTLIDVLSKE